MTQPRARPHPTIAAFERAYAERSGVSVEQLHAYGLYAEPCDCGEDGCEGFAMRHQWEDAIVEDRGRAEPFQLPPISEEWERHWQAFPGTTAPIVFGRLEPGMIFYGMDAGNRPDVEVTITASRSGCSGSFERLDVLGLQDAARELELTLSPGVSYEVHHINGDPTDNTPANLRLMPGGSWSQARAAYDGAVAAFSDAPTHERAGAVIEATQSLFAEALGQLAIDGVSGLDDHLARPRTRLPADVEDSLSHELTDLARAGKEEEFRALASTCVAPGEVDDLWEKLGRLIR